MVNQKKYQANLKRHREEILERFAPTTEALAMISTASDDHDRMIAERDDAIAAVYKKFAPREHETNRELAHAVANARKKMTATEITEHTTLSAARQRELLDLIKDDSDDDSVAAEPDSSGNEDGDQDVAAAATKTD